MARYRRRRFYRKKARYSPNILRIGPNSYNISAQSRDISVLTLIENQAYDSSRSNNIITIKNPEISIDFDASSTYIESCTAYIMFIPEGYTTNINTPTQHPEWIMAYKFFGSPNFEVDNNSNLYPTVKYVNRVKSRLSRKLNTGDRIVLLVEASNRDSSIARSIQYQGLCRWWTKAN